MSSMFDTMVYKKRRRAEFLSPSVIDFMKSMALNTQHFDSTHAGQTPDDHPDITLSVSYRGSVASGYWYVLKWVDVDGKPYRVEAQTVDLLGWRAITQHEEVRKNMLQVEKGACELTKGMIYPDCTHCESCRAPMYKNKKEEAWCSNIYCPY